MNNLKPLLIALGVTIAFITVLCFLNNPATDEISRGSQSFTCNITNLRVDDDSEYHITYTYPSGRVESMNDRKETDMDTFTVRRDYISKPIVILHIDYIKRRNGETDYYGDPTKTEVILPMDYNIHEMSDF